MSHLETEGTRGIEPESTTPQADAAEIAPATPVAPTPHDHAHADSPAASVTPSDLEQSTGSFVHLHVHTEYSALDGLSRLQDIAKKAAADGQPAIAITDHGSLGGVWKFASACKDAGIKPIIGVEAYLALVCDGSDHVAKEGADLKGKPVCAKCSTDKDPKEWPCQFVDGVDAMDDRVRFLQHTRRTPDAETGELKKSSYNHLTILVRNERGWRNLAAMMAEAEASYDAGGKHAMIDYALLKKWGRHNPDGSGDGGLIVLTGCLGGPVASAFAQNLDEEAYAAVARLQDCVGEENVYIEIMEHGLAIEQANLRKMAELSDTTGRPLVVTNDSHFTDACDHGAHDAWLAVQTQSQLSDPTRWSFNGHGYHMKTAQEMRETKRGPRWEAACNETLRIAERIDDNVLPYTGLRLPDYPIPADFVPHRNDAALSPAAAYLRHLVRQGAVQRYGGTVSADGRTILPQEVVDRLKYELGIITDMGLDAYFLIVGDVIEWARSDRGLPTPEHPMGEPGKKKPIYVGPGRGSAAGSVVSYCLRIVMIDPLPNGLLFERFLEPGRKGEMPDIDVDFETRRRNEVYAYLSARYGEENIARIGSFGIARSKAAIKSAARVLGLQAVGNKLASLVPVVQGKPATFKELFDEHNPAGNDFRKFLEESEEGTQVAELASKFEDITSSLGIHSAGVLIGDEPIFGLLPMRKDRRKDAGEVPVVLWDGKDVDKFGMLKLDALAIRNLDIVAMAREAILRNTGEDVDYDNLPDPDNPGNERDAQRVANAFRLMQEGKTEGVFQLESAGITDLAVKIVPDSFADLTALVALYRPGPMGTGMHLAYAERKNGRASIDYSIFGNRSEDYPLIANVLGETFGLVVYQEQLMNLATELCGWDGPLRNKLRKAFSKKIKELMDELKIKFFEDGVQENTLPDGRISPPVHPETLEKVWQTFDASAAYLFNKSHSATYGYLSYVTAFYKANWPVEYGAALLSVTDSDERRQAALTALAREGIEVLPPHVNYSLAHTSTDLKDPTKVRLGLSEIKDVGVNGVHIVAERETAAGPFTSIQRVAERVSMPAASGKGYTQIPVTAMEALVEAGAFDELPILDHGPSVTRLDMMRNLRALKDRNLEAIHAPVGEEWGVLEKSARQRGRLGMSAGEHPMLAFADEIEKWDTSAIFDDYDGGYYNDDIPRPRKMNEIRRGDQTVITVGLLTYFKEKQHAKIGQFAEFAVESGDTFMKGIVWNRALRAMQNIGALPNEGEIVAMIGRPKVKVATFTNDEGEIEEGEEYIEFDAGRIAALALGRSTIQPERVTRANADPDADPWDEEGTLASRLVGFVPTLEMPSRSSKSTDTGTKKKTPVSRKPAAKHSAAETPVATPAVPLPTPPTRPTPAQRPATVVAIPAQPGRIGHLIIAPMAPEKNRFVLADGSSMTVAGAQPIMRGLLGKVPSAWEIFPIDLKNRRELPDGDEFVLKVFGNCVMTKDACSAHQANAFCDCECDPCLEARSRFFYVISSAETDRRGIEDFPSTIAAADWSPSDQSPLVFWAPLPPGEFTSAPVDPVPVDPVLPDTAEADLAPEVDPGGSDWDQTDDEAYDPGYDPDFDRPADAELPLGA